MVQLSPSKSKGCGFDSHMMHLSFFSRKVYDFRHQNHENGQCGTYLFHAGRRGTGVLIRSGLKTSKTLGERQIGSFKLKITSLR